MTETAVRKPDRAVLAFAVLLAAAGLYFMLAGIGVAPPPGKTDAPGFVIVLVGLAFLAAGGSLMVRGLLGITDRQADLPADTPRSLQALYILNGLLVMTALASIGTWVALNAGDGEVKVSGMISGVAGANVGRTVFGIGAVIAWLMVFAMGRAGWKKLSGRQD